VSASSFALNRALWSVQEGDATEGVPSESSVPGEPEVIHGAVGARAVRPSPAQ
jgi:hypothetical protein